LTAVKAADPRFDEAAAMLTPRLPPCAPFAVAAALVLLALAPAQAQTQSPPLPPGPAASAGPAPLAAPAALSDADRAAIRAVLEDAPAQGLPISTPAADAGDSVLISALLRYATWQHGGRVTPARVSSMWGLEPDSFDAQAEFEAARREGRLSAWANQLAPTHAAYRELLGIRRRYATLLAAGGFPRLDRSVLGLRAGSEGAGVAALRTRLAAEGFVAAPLQDPATFDEILWSALDAFRATRGLARQSTLGAADLAALNEDPAALLARMDLNLERERWVPRRAVAGDRIEVNIPATALELHQGGAVTLQMRTVVGKPATQTPMFAAAVRSIVFNPPWIVPASIARNELSRRSAAYLARQNIRNVGGRYIQAPGQNSALGVLKFDFANRWGVYLHDTGSRGVFS
jgi:murein L,D-transpeptidase YcbB/YkuD